MPAPRTSVFVSYAHRDAEFLKRLQVHLAPLVRDENIALWDDTHIKPGQNWKQEITAALAAARVAILLISPDFLASKFIHAEELPPLLGAAKNEGAVILPLIVGHSTFARSGLSVFQAINPPSEPLATLAEADRDLVYVRLAERIADIFSEDMPASDAEDADAVDEPAPEGDVFHPGNRIGSRLPLEPCSFFVSPFYAHTKLWNLYADVQVELHHAISGSNVFLIPSGAVSPRLRDTFFLRSAPGLEVVARKKRVTDAFVDKYRNKELAGQKFVMHTKDAQDRVKVYCAAYDVFLMAAFSDG